jgi:hypothetical protein
MTRVIEIASITIFAALVPSSRSVVAGDCRALQWVNQVVDLWAEALSSHSVRYEMRGTRFW